MTIDKGQIIGDPFDIKMFEGVGWILRENFDDKNNGGKAYDPLVQVYVRPKNEKN